MQPVRRKTIKTPPIAIVRSSLIFNPVASTASEATSFSDVLVEAVNAPRSPGNSYAFHGEMNAALESKLEQAAVPTPTAWSPQQKSPVDLYEQLDTLLRAKSLLLAVV